VKFLRVAASGTAGLQSFLEPANFRRLEEKTVGLSLLAVFFTDVSLCHGLHLHLSEGLFAECGEGHIEGRLFGRSCEVCILLSFHFLRLVLPFADFPMEDRALYVFVGGGDGKIFALFFGQRGGGFD